MKSMTSLWVITRSVLSTAIVTPYSFQTVSSWRADPLRKVTFDRVARPVRVSAGGVGASEVSRGSELTTTKSTSVLRAPSSWSAWMISWASTGQMSSHSALKNVRTTTLPLAPARSQDPPVCSRREIAGAWWPARRVSPMTALGDASTAGACRVRWVWPVRWRPSCRSPGPRCRPVWSPMLLPARPLRRCR